MAITIESRDMLDILLVNASGVVVMDCRQHHGIDMNPYTTAVLKEASSRFGTDVLFLRMDPSTSYSFFAERQISKLPVVLIASKDRYGANALEIKAKVYSKDINLENIIALISEYKQDIRLT